MSTEICKWKKVFEVDLESLIIEMGEALDSPSMVILTGPLGVGKTTFVRHYIGEETVSPTYSVVNEIGVFAHADLYRLEDVNELQFLELEYLLENKDMFFVEWGKKYIEELKELVPEDFSIFELEIEVNTCALSEDKVPSRDFTLTEIDL